MEKGEGRRKSITEWKNVFAGRNPDTGKPYFERRKITRVDPDEPPEISFTEKDLMTKEEYEKFKAGQADGSQQFEQKAYTQGDLIPLKKEQEE
jgi:hypothetical protein